MKPDLVYSYLTARSAPPLSASALIIGFGHFDLRIARQCADLWQRRLAPRVLFTGGVGAGSADLGMPEAEAFKQELLRVIPDFPHDRLMTEPASTNTGENVRFSLSLLQEAGWQIDSAILVATPFRQRRVNQTWSKVTAGIPFQSAPPPSDFSTDKAIFRAKGEDLIAQLPGEIERLQSYPKRGWIENVSIPTDVLRAAENE